MGIREHLRRLGARRGVQDLGAFQRASTDAGADATPIEVVLWNVNASPKVGRARLDRRHRSRLPTATGSGPTVRVRIPGSLGRR